MSAGRVLDTTDAAFLANPYPALAALREHAAVVHDEGTGHWLVTRHAEVGEVLRDRRLGREYDHRYTEADLGQARRDDRWPAFDRHERWSLLRLEPPEHTRLRRLVGAVFTPSAVLALRPDVERLAAAHLTALDGHDDVDVLANFAQPFSVAVICSLLGVPSGDTASLLAWSHAIVKRYELRPTEAQAAAAEQAAEAFMAYVADLVAAKRARPDDRLVSRLATVRDHRAGLTDDEITSTVIVLLNAGHEATVNGLGNGLRALLHHRHEWNRLTRGEVPARVAVEEVLRWDPPLQLFSRWVLDDGVEMAGAPLALGSRVSVLFGAANRDPRRFAEPDRFDVGRGDAGHVTFGAGIHFCLGAPLARLELEVSLDAIARRFPGLALAAEPAYAPTFVLRGLTALRVATR